MLTVEGLVSCYGRAHILHEVSLQVGQGEAAVLLGRNGAGKSTTLKSIMGLVRPTTGTVRFRDRDITRQPIHAIARLGLGYVPEERRIFPELSVRENLEVGRQPPRDGVPSWTPEKLFELFPGLADLRDRPAGRTSGGEQQMLTIARALMGNPMLVLLDEPSEGLAPVVVDQLAGAVVELKRAGLGVLLSEQNLGFARRIAERVYLIEQGHIRHHGPIADLAGDSTLRQAYLGL